MKSLLGCLAFLCAAVAASAAPNWVAVKTATGSKSGGSAQIILEIDTNNEGSPSGYAAYRLKWALTGSIPADQNNGTSGTLWVESSWGSPTFRREMTPYGIDPPGTSAKDIKQNGTTITIYVKWQSYSGTGVDTSVQTLASATWTAGAPAEKYKVTFRIPANNTDRLIRYEAKQNGVTVASLTTSPGDPASEATFQNLDSDAVVVLHEVSANLVQGADGTWYVGESDYVRTVNGGTTPVPSSATATPANVTPPDATSTNGGNTKPAPTASNNNTTVNIWSSSSGGAPTGGSTTPVSDSLYKEGVDKSNANANKNAKDALDQAKDAAAAAASAAANTQNKLDGLKSSMDGVKTSVDAVKSAVDQHKAKTEETTAAVNALKTSLESRLPNQDTGSATGAVTSETGNALARIGAAKSQGEGVFGGLLADRTVAVPQVQIGAGTSQKVQLFEGIQATKKEWELNPALTDMAPPWVDGLISWFRAFVGWASVLGFFAYAMHEIRGAIGAVFLTNAQMPFGPQMAATAIPVAGAAISITARIAIMAVIAAAAVAMPSALVQVFSTEWSQLLNTFAQSMASGSGGSGGESMGSLIGIANQFVPVATCLTVMASYTLFELAILPVQGIWQWTMRFLPL